MKHHLIPGLAAALAIAAPATAFAQPTGPALGDPAPPPPPAEKPDKKGPGLLETLGGAVGGAIAGTAGAAGGPVASAAAGFVGKRLGSGAVGMVKNVLGDDDKDEEDQAPEIVRINPPAPAADLTTTDVATTEPVRLDLPPTAGPRLDQALRDTPQSIQTISPGAPLSSPVSNAASNAASPGG